MKDQEIFDLVTTRELGVDAINFAVADWTNVSSLPGHTNFSGHTRTVIQESPIHAASVKFALQTMGCQARVAALQYDLANQQVWSYFPAAVHNGPNNVQAIDVDIKSALEAAYARAAYVYLMVQVKGQGAMYLGRVAVTWLKPDFVDYAPAIADLVTRVSTLESGGTGGSAPYDDSEIRARITALENRFAAMRAALTP